MQSSAWQLFLWCPLALLAVRPQTPTVINSNDHDGNSSVTDNSTMAGVRYNYEVILKPGPIGIHFDDATGKIWKVYKNKQAHEVGIQAGNVMIKVNGEPWTAKRMRQAKLRAEPYTITLQYESQITTLDRLGLWVEIFVALGTFCWFLRAIWRGDRLTDFLRDPVTLCALVLLHVGDMIDWGFTWSRWWRINTCRRLTILVSPFPLLGAAVGLDTSFTLPLMEMPLSDEAAASLRTQNNVLRLLGLAIICHDFFSHMSIDLAAVAFTDPLVTANAMMADRFYRILWWLYMLEYIASTHHIAAATVQRMVAVQSSMPCKAVEFEERVRRPCVEFLEELEPQLALLGLPLLCMSMQAPMNGLRLWIHVQGAIMSPFAISQPTWWLLSGRYCVEVMVLALGSASPPLQISSALTLLRRSLGAARLSDAALHVPVLDVETMLDGANDGRGLGISVYGKLTLDKAAVQQLCLTIVLSYFAITAYLKSQFGYAKEQFSYETELAIEKNVEELHLWVAQATNNISNLSANIVDTHAKVVNTMQRVAGMERMLQRQARG